MRKPARSPIIAAAVAAMIACGTAQNGATDFAVRDSAGIRIVENAESSGEVRRDLVEELRIGVIAGEEPYQLDRVLDVTVDERGRIYVANNGSLTIRVYNATGQFLHEVGGRGNGPGEFARMI